MDTLNESGETDWWWIDYLENELDGALNADLELLLQHSESDQNTFENFRLLKEWVATLDPAKDVEIPPQTGKRIWSKVSEQIEEETKEPTHAPWP